MPDWDNGDSDNEAWKKWGTAVLGVLCVVVLIVGLAECTGT